MKNNPLYLRQPPLEQMILTAATERKRLLVHGRVGTGRLTAVKHTLTAANYEVHTVDLSGILTVADLDRAFRRKGKGGGMSAILRTLDGLATKKRAAVVIANVDGCRGLDAESSVVGALRSQLQVVQDLAVFFTAADNGFIARNFAHPKASFFKQVVIVNMAPLTAGAVDEMVNERLGGFLRENVKALIIDGAGLWPGDLAHLMQRIDGLPRTPNLPLTGPEVGTVLTRIVSERKATYEFWLHTFLSGHQRAALTAFARGVPLRATKEMAGASGVPVASLGGAIRGLERLGCVHALHRGHAFSDPFLRLYLRSF